MSRNSWTVIVVEDAYDDQQIISTILQHADIDTLVAENGEVCLRLMQAEHPTLIVTDLAMPEMDGWQLMQQLQANVDTANIPVIAVSAFYSPHVAKKAEQAGFAACLPKPLKPAEFVDFLATFVDS